MYQATQVDSSHADIGMPYAGIGSSIFTTSSGLSPEGIPLLTQYQDLQTCMPQTLF